MSGVAATAMGLGFLGVGLGLAGAAITLLAFGWNEARETAIPAVEIARMERARSGLRGVA